MTELEYCVDCKEVGITDSEVVFRCDVCDKWLCHECGLCLASGVKTFLGYQRVKKGDRMWLCHECDDKRPQSEKELDMP